jgi:hypothetical protein
MARIWTHGIWTVKAGHESNFVAAWRELVPLGSSYGSDDPRLLRDREQTNVYRSFGSWRSLEDIESFRGAIAPEGERDGRPAGQFRDVHAGRGLSR